MRVKKNFNEHRSGKKCFQAYLFPEEKELVAFVKAKLGGLTDRSLLVSLCEDKALQLGRSKKKSLKA